MFGKQPVCLSRHVRNSLRVAWQPRRGSLQLRSPCSVVCFVLGTYGQTRTRGAHHGVHTSIRSSEMGPQLLYVRYEDLQAGLNLSDQMAAAFGPGRLGAIAISDVPGVEATRREVLLLLDQLAVRCTAVHSLTCRFIVNSSDVVTLDTEATSWTAGALCPQRAQVHGALGPVHWTGLDAYARDSY
jgi:hypothetical protein